MIYIQASKLVQFYRFIWSAETNSTSYRTTDNSILNSQFRKWGDRFSASILVNPGNGL